MSAIGELRYADPVAAALGLRSGAVLIDAQPRVWVEAGERSLFGIAGLSASHVRAGLCGDRSACIASVVHARSPVGSETALDVTLALGPPGAVRVWCTVSGAQLAVVGGRPSQLATVDAGAVSPSVRGLSVAYAIEGIRAAGYPLAGSDSALMVTLARGVVTGVGGLRIGRGGDIGVWAGARISAGRLDLAAGYDDATAVLRGALAVRVASIDVVAGTAAHPVLGVSQSLFVRWAR